MNRYESSIPRAVLGMAAVAMTALTLGVSVLAPVHLASAPHGSPAVASNREAPPVVIEAEIIPSRIEVVGTHTQKTAFEPPRRSVPKRGQTS